MAHLLQVVLPLGDIPDKRAGRDPKRDTDAYPPGGPCIEGVTGEVVCIRRAPDLDALRRRARHPFPSPSAAKCHADKANMLTTFICGLAEICRACWIAAS